MSDFLARWSRRKSEAKAPPLPSDRPDQEAESTSSAGSGDQPAAGPEAFGGSPEPLEEAAELVGEPISPEEIAALPPVESLTAQSDLGPFLRAGVPALLRKAALRRMWAVDPGIRDFLNDAREYAYDWNAPGGVPGLGPLSPSDDVKAMVRRLFEGPCQSPAAQGADALVAEEHGGEPPREAEHPADGPREIASSAGRDDARLEPSPSGDAPPLARDDGGGDPAPAPAARLSDGPRPRRHGGATPT